MFSREGPSFLAEAFGACRLVASILKLKLEQELALMWMEIRTRNAVKREDGAGATWLVLIVGLQRQENSKQIRRLGTLGDVPQQWL